MKWILFLPEIYCLLMAAAFFGLAMLPRTNPRRDYQVAVLLASVGVLISLMSVRLHGTLFFEAYRIDLFSQVFKVMLAMGLFLVICLCTELRGVEERYHPEFYLFLTTCTFAMMMLVSAVELLTIYIALELSSYSLYILVPLRRGPGTDVEAGIKYLMVGASASAVMLFGLSYIFGVTHTTYVAEIMKILPTVITTPAAMIGLLLTLCGFFFKLAVFPFHFWAPDVYQGASNQVTAFIATASKVGAVAILMRMVALTGGASKYLVDVLVVLSIASMTIGNLTAIVQKDMKRLLAYSSISHAGYVLIGILSMSASGYASAIFYAVAYLIMNLCCFLVVVNVAYDGSDLKIAQLAGLHRRSPLLAMTLMLAVFGLAGIPPTIGFTGKFLVFAAAVARGHLVLVIIAMINATISLYYYILVVKAAYLLEPDVEMERLNISMPTKVLAGALVAVMVVIGIYPHHVLEVARAAAKGLMM
ncbi:MAG: NADH-quinone oxidoreductase subunit N [Deltaproteobacteria bacterium]|nr:NADH-quinone oxidoreductase subunit N [Deltaproteobacteria bacterium]MBW2071238.1 NADH-quinone oxidoreductase subunit N [Deltaproteobacteria bacterium]